VAAGLAVLVPGAAGAQTIGSVYTRIDDRCTQRQLPGEPAYETACRGHGEWSVYIVAGEHGAAAAYGRRGEAMSDYAGPPMRGLFGGYNDVVEWRLEDGRAFATIHRYIHYNPPEMLEVSGGLEEPNTLIVTALRADGDRPACPVAHVDASALPQANAVARDVADRLARGWDCSLDPVTFDAALPDVEAYLSEMNH
jgi:hypothetical protein